ncbi:MAG: polysaccharide deacetylase family protein [Desulfitobacterium hafniense]|nr:polysaccharide deacetylase family protein [Desulfitobacterium hafniense]
MRIFIIRRSTVMKATFFVLIVVTLGLLSYYPNTESLKKAPGTYYMATTGDKVVALTFDDGPDPAFTIPILDILKQERVQATFFVLGQTAKDNQRLLNRMISEGHEIGNHGYTHDYRGRKIVEEIKRTDQLVFEATGFHTYFYRPPGGFASKEQIDIVRNNGHVLTLWSVDSKDWRNKGSRYIIQNVLDGVFPGAIILLHDGGEKREQTVNALPSIIDQLRQKGYKFVTLSELRTLDSELK